MAGLKSKIGAILNRSVKYRAVRMRMKIHKQHRILEERYLNNSKGKKYYIIRFSDPQSSGWTVWERVALYGAIYAEEHNMFPVMDMKSGTNIYQEEGEKGKVNVWDTYYETLVGVTLEEAIASDNYVLADPSMEWFNYVRIRRHFTETELRNAYGKYVRLNSKTIEEIKNRWSKVMPNADTESRMIAIKLRGTDYLKYHHAKQPSVAKIAKVAIKVAEEYNCKYFYLATEDYNLYSQLISSLPNENVVSYKAGNVKDVDGFINDELRKDNSARDVSMDYLTTLYILNECVCLIGGVCGATIVAKYRRNPPYEYINIIDMNESY